MQLFTSVRISLVTKETLRAMVSCKVAEAVFLTGMRVIEGKNGLFVSMPSKKDVGGEYHDIYFPASREIRDQLQAAVLEAYRAAAAKAGGQPAADAPPAGQAPPPAGDDDIPF